jgi:hypothetical protein
VLGLLLVALGAVIAGRALKSAATALPRFAWRPLVVGTVALFIFALFINKLGLAVTAFLVVIVSRLARAENPWLETIILGIALTVGCALVFLYGLGINLPLLPRLG